MGVDLHTKAVNIPETNDSVVGYKISYLILNEKYHTKCIVQFTLTTMFS